MAERPNSRRRGGNPSSRWPAIADHSGLEFSSHDTVTGSFRAANNGLADKTAKSYEGRVSAILKQFAEVVAKKGAGDGSSRMSFTLRSTLFCNVEKEVLA